MIDNFSPKHIHDIDGYIEQLLKGNLLSEIQILNLCEKAKEVLAQEENVVSVSAPVTICGAVNGQFIDLLELFQHAGNIPDTNYLFLGDYASRSYHNGVEIISLLLAYKVRYNKRVTLLRGQVDNRNVSKFYHFYDECMHKYNSPDVWKSLTDVFDYLPLAAIVENSIFCVHGGLSPTISSITDLQSLQRIQETPGEGPLLDILWSEPDNTTQERWSELPGSKKQFSQKVTEEFLYHNNLKMICRTQFMMEGYSFHHDELVVTVFSAPNYVGRCRNLAAVLELDDTLDMNL